MKLNIKVLNTISHLKQSLIFPKQGDTQKKKKQPMIYFLSYPKSGRTWIRFMINSYFCRINKLEIPNILLEVQEVDVLSNKYPFMWNHLDHDLWKNIPYWGVGNCEKYELQGAACILLTRNFYATCSSAYHQVVHRVKVFSGSPSEFIRSPRYGVIKLVTFYNRLDEIIPQLGRFEFVNYDAMLENPVDSFVKILEYAHLDIDEAIVAEVVKQGSFDNMKRLAQSPPYGDLGRLAPTDRDNPDSHKVRVGGDSKYRDLFTDDDIAYINQVIETMLVNKNAPYLAGCWNRAD